MREKLAATLEVHIYANQLVEKWVKEAPNENCLEAKRRIDDFFCQEKDFLDLSGLDLSSLPNIFNHNDFSRLCSLKLDHNKLASLPESIGDLQSLQELNLDGNRLTNLPRSTVGLQVKIWPRIDLFWDL